MAKILVFGDIDIAPLYLSIDGCKEITVSGKYPQSFPLEAGSHDIAATTVSKLERMTEGWGGSGVLSAATAALQNGTNTTLGGTLTFAEDDVLLIQVEQKGFKTLVYNKMVPAAEVSRYENLAVTYGDKKSRKKRRWLWLIPALPLAIVLLLFLWVFMAKSSSL
ncbi:MAG: hypothetical protein IK954_04140 [Clostridia bacterium]|nr:hypothetical protein [Clostridia bacterium]